MKFLQELGRMSGLAMGPNGGGLRAPVRFSDTGPYFLSGPADGVPVSRLDEGEVLAERYAVQRLLREGSASCIYLMHDMLLDVDVASKVVAVSGPGSDGAIRRILAEAAAYGRIQDNRHVIRGYGLHHATRGADEVLFMTTEYAPSGDLRQWLNAHQQDVSTRCSTGLAYIVQACRGLQELHQRGIIHGDLKPENVLLFGELAKVTDFAVPNAVGTADGMCTPRPAAISPYTSPEARRPASPLGLSPSSDIYAIGAMLYEMLDGENSWPSDHRNGLLVAFQGAIARDFLPDVPEGLRRAVLRCLAMDPNNRLSSAREVLQALREDPLRPARNAGQTNEQEVDAVWSCVKEHLAAGNLVQAKTLCVEVIELAPRHGAARALAEELERRFTAAEGLYEAVQNAMATEGLAELVTALREAMGLFPNHPRGRAAQAQLLARGRRYQGLVQEGAQALQRGIWEEARHCFALAQELNPSARIPRFWVAGLNRFLQRQNQLRRQLDAAMQCHEQGNSRMLATMMDREEAHFKEIVRTRTGRTE